MQGIQSVKTARLVAALALVAITTAATVGVSAQSARDDFARGVEVRPDGPGSIFRLLLPDDVYATATRGDLSDLRVFNAAGKAVPHAVREASARPRGDRGTIALPSFPLYRRNLDTRALTHLQIGKNGAVLEVRRDPDPDRVVAAYLVDASALKDQVDLLSLDFDDRRSSGFLVELQVDGSDDLSGWRTIVSGAAVAQMQHGGHTLTQSTIALPPTRLRYLRIPWPRALASVTLTAVRVRPWSGRPAETTQWKTIEGRTSPDAPGAIVYDAGARLPIGQVAVAFSEPTAAASFTVRARPDPSAAWRTVHTGVFYALADAVGRVTGPAALIERTTDRYWMLETSRDGGWERGRLPRLQLGWLPHELVFLAQGDAPYTLAYGSARAGRTDQPVDELLASLSARDGVDRTRPATLGEPHNLAGAEALQPAPPWRRLGLWAVLIGAVLALAWFALRAFRDSPVNLPRT